LSGELIQFTYSGIMMKYQYQRKRGLKLTENEYVETKHLPEFLAIFNNQGDFKVKLKLIKYDVPGAGVADQTMTGRELEKLIDPETGMFFTRMFFDDHLFQIIKYDINLAKKMVVITASP